MEVWCQTKLKNDRAKGVEATPCCLSIQNCFSHFAKLVNSSDARYSTKPFGVLQDKQNDLLSKYRIVFLLLNFLFKEQCVFLRRYLPWSGEDFIHCPL